MLTIQKTMDYSQFKFLPENRPTTPKHLLESIQRKDLLEEHPVICDQEMYVIDGQNRVKACELLGLPVYFVVSHKVSKDDIGLCQVQKPWVMLDYMRYFKDKEGKEDYRFIHEIMELYSLPVHFVIYACSPSGDSYEKFKHGKYIIKKDKEDLRKKFQMMNEIFITIKRLANSRNSKATLTIKSQKCFWHFMNRGTYNHNHMMRKISKHPDNVVSILGSSDEGAISAQIHDRIYYFDKDGKGLLERDQSKE